MKSYGMATLAPLATTQPLAASGGTGDPGVPGRGTKAIATANLQIKLPESVSWIPKACRSGLRSSVNFYSSQVSNMLT